MIFGAPGQDLNRRLTAYKAVTLPLSYKGELFYALAIIPTITAATMITRTVIHRGDNTHHQLQVIVPINLWCMNNKVSRLINPAPLLFTQRKLLSDLDIEHLSIWLVPLEGFEPPTQTF